MRFAHPIPIKWYELEARFFASGLSDVDRLFVHQSEARKPCGVTGLGSHWLTFVIRCAWCCHDDPSNSGQLICKSHAYLVGVKSSFSII